MREEIANIHIYPSSFKNESRIEKLAESIEKLDIFSEILLIGTAQAGLSGRRQIGETVSIVLLGIENRNAGFIYKIVTFIFWYFSVTRFLFGKQVKCINAHSLSSLPLAVVIKSLKGCKLIYDTHELETETNSLSGFRKRLAKVVEQIFIKCADHIFVVSESIADWYEERYQVVRPTVVLNVPKLSNPCKADLFREKFPINSNQLIMIYQGDMARGRGVEIILEAFMSRQQNDVVAIFMGDGPLRERIVSASEICRNIFFHEFVNTRDVLKYTSSADIGISLIENTCLSYYYCLPNKLFEYAMSGLPVIVSNVVEMKNFVETHEMGVVTAGIDKNSFNEAVNQLIEGDLRIYGENARKAAKENSWEIQEIKLHKVYQVIFNLEKCK